MHYSLWESSCIAYFQRSSTNSWNSQLSIALSQLPLSKIHIWSFQFPPPSKITSSYLKDHLTSSLKLDLYYLWQFDFSQYIRLYLASAQWSTLILFSRTTQDLLLVDRGIKNGSPIATKNRFRNQHSIASRCGTSNAVFILFQIYRITSHNCRSPDIVFNVSFFWIFV